MRKLVLVLASVLMFGSVTTTWANVEGAPSNELDRRPPGEDDGEDSGEDAEVLCPTDLWTIPLEIEGLACVLLLPKE